MKPKSPNDYVFFGTCIRYLQDANTRNRIHDDGNVMYILSNIERFYELLEELNLHVTQRAANQLGLNNLQEELKIADRDANLNKAQAEKLSSIMDIIRETLEAEIKGFEIYLITPKRIEATRLVSNVSSLFPPNVFDKLPEIARYDIKEAGKCIAFERSTAAAFHLMRTVESVLREFYCHHVKRNRCNMLWGPIVQNLRSKRKFKDNKEYNVLFNNLDNIRLSFRNPTQHPEKVYDIQEVQDLWALSVDVINRMAKDL